MTFLLPSASLDLQVPIMSDQRVCRIAYLVNNLWKLRDAYHSHKPPAAGGKLVHRYKTIDNFTESIKYLVYTPKCAIIVVFDFPWGDCIKRRKKLETMVMKNLVGGGGESRKQGAQLWSRRKW